MHYVALPLSPWHRELLLARQVTEYLIGVIRTCSLVSVSVKQNCSGEGDDLLKPPTNLSLLKINQYQWVFTVTLLAQCLRASRQVLIQGRFQARVPSLVPSSVKVKFG